MVHHSAAKTATPREPTPARAMAPAAPSPGRLRNHEAFNPREGGDAEPALDLLRTFDWPPALTCIGPPAATVNWPLTHAVSAAASSLSVADLCRDQRVRASVRGLSPA